MAKKTDPNARLDAELLETARDLRGTLPRKETADKITMRVLGRTMPRKPDPLKPEEVRAIRENAGLSQAVFAALLNLTTGYLSELERGAKRPAGTTLALLQIIRRKGIEAVL
jgi:putative transcriptional regulator